MLYVYISINIYIWYMLIYHTYISVLIHIVYIIIILLDILQEEVAGGFLSSKPARTT